jgi:chromate transporter
MARSVATPGAQAVLAGLASVGIAAMLVAGMKTAGALKGDRALVLVAIATFVAVGVLRLPLIPAALTAAAISVALSYRASRAG